MISPADDFLLHQTTDTFDRVFTSDRNFYDRYYFNLHSSSDELFLVIGMGQYPNLGTTDAFVTVSHGEKQYCVRASRELGSDRLNTTVGPITISVIEGLRRFHLVSAPNEWGIELDVTWEGDIPSIQEPPFFTRVFNRVVSEGNRITQTGFYTGRLKVAGQSYDVTPDRWKGIRDHSWGIRPVGDPEAPGIRSKLVASEGRLWNWVPMQFADFSIHYMAAEDQDGNRSQEEAVMAFPYRFGRENVHLGRPQHHMKFQPGTRRVAPGTRVEFPDAPEKPITAYVTPLRNMYLMAGTGYGGGEFRHGQYLGELDVAGFVYDPSDAAFLKQYGVFVETLARFEINGEVGYGMYEHSLSGIYRPYGFETAADVAR